MEEIGNKVSIITICYNCKADLENTIVSVISQQYPAKEYIVIDGGSTDGTAEVLDKYKNQIDVCISETDEGIYDALNKGIRHAAGEWIICMNAGDVFRSDNVLSDIFSQHIPEEKTFIYSDFELVHGDGASEIRRCDRSQGEVHHQNAIYRRSLHEQHGYYTVTHPYIVSDLLFFLSVPPEQFLKTPHVIAKVKDGGIACGLWASEQAWAAKAAFGIESIPQIFFRSIRLRFGLWRQKMKSNLLSLFKCRH
jgi:glycosyltransferase involved in cell wall biosynthesis